MNKVCKPFYKTARVNSDNLLAMTAMFCEMQSFMWKFSQLLNYGSDANISFSCVNGRVQVNLVADIGSNRPEHYRSEASGRNFTNSQLKPSKIRRRNRRRAARSKQNLQVDVNTGDIGLQASENDANSEGNITIFDVSVKSDAVPEVASNKVAFVDTAVQAAPVAFDASCKLTLRMLTFLILPL